MPVDEESISQTQEHFEVLAILAEEFCLGYSAERGTTIHIDKSLLLLVASSAMQDIERYKLYHLNDPSSMKSDAVKRTAYIVYWILKFRPLTILKDSGEMIDTNDDSFLANEIFCLNLSGTYLSSEAKKNFYYPQDKARELIYNFLYRDLTTDALILFFQTIKDTLKNKAVIITT